jgi:hypothetical protein
MASINYKSLSALQPVELKYQYYRDEDFKGTKVSYADGYTFYKHDSLVNYRDTTINRESVFVLTSALPLQTVFPLPDQYQYGELPGTFLLQPRNTTIYYAAYKESTKTIGIALTGSRIFLSPVAGSNQVELLIDNKYLQVDKIYPYTVTINSRPLSPGEINRQRFECIYQNSTITLKTKTQDGYRYLAFSGDNVLRAIGINLNNNLLNDYVFKCVPVTTSTLELNLKPENKWVTYFYTSLQEQENKTVSINKEFLAPTNYLIDFPAEQAAKTGKAYINIANLKTSVTPFGAPAPLNNLPE